MVRRSSLNGVVAAVVFCLLAAVARLPAQSSQNTSAELESLVAALREKPSFAAYTSLRKFSERNEAHDAGARAAFVLGSYDYEGRRYQDAATWFDRARADSVLRQYADYWGALAQRGLGQNARALERLEKFRREYPASALTPLAIKQSAEAALLAGRAARAVEMLTSYAKTDSEPPLLLLRAEAYEKSHQTRRAAIDYAAIYFQYPLTEEAKVAGPRMMAMRRALGAEAPPVTGEMKLARAEVFYNANKCRDAMVEYNRIIPSLSDAAKDLARLHHARCRLRLGAAPAVLTGLTLTDPEAEAERLYALSQAYRPRKQVDLMLEAVERLMEKYPQSPWAEEGLFAAGNYFWVELDRARAAQFYERQVTRYPAGKNVMAAHWRIAWRTYLDVPADAPVRISEHLRKFPGSQYTANALYWLGRSAERAGDPPRARAFYQKAIERFPQTYFGLQSVDRLRALGPGPMANADVLALIPSAAPTPLLDSAIPPAARGYWQRAQALRAIGFAAQSETELRAAYAATRSPRLLLEAAQAAHEASRYSAGILAARQVVPQIEARRLEELPTEVWRSVYPLAFSADISKSAQRAGVDPMLVAGIIRQESVFQRDAVSRAGAVGLMQMMPSTGRQLARQQKIRYSRVRLMQPDFNLRLGTVHLATLVNSYDTLEKALAAYNAGEHRVTAWTEGRSYSEPAEFVESIPFTETREYVQIVIRNTHIYRGLYSNENQKGEGK